MSLTYIETARPTAFLLENVLGILAIDDGAYFKKVLRWLHVSGSDVIWHGIANSFRFDVAQSRRRVNIIGALRHVAKLDFVFPDGDRSQPQLCGLFPLALSADLDDTGLPRFLHAVLKMHCVICTGSFAA